MHRPNTNPWLLSPNTCSSGRSGLVGPPLCGGSAPATPPLLQHASSTIRRVATKCLSHRARPPAPAPSQHSRASQPSPVGAPPVGALVPPPNRYRPPSPLKRNGTPCGCPVPRRPQTRQPTIPPVGAPLVGALVPPPNRYRPPSPLKRNGTPCGCPVPRRPQTRQPASPPQGQAQGLPFALLKTRRQSQPPLPSNVLAPLSPAPPSNAPTNHTIPPAILFPSQIWPEPRNSRANAPKSVI